MGNTPTKEAVVPPAVVTTKVSSEFGTEKECHHDEDFSTVQTVGSESLLSPNRSQASPINSMTMVTVDTEHIGEDFDSVFSAITLNDSVAPVHSVRWWDGRKFFSDFVQDGLKAQKSEDSSICMVFENPSTSPQEASFFNGNTFKFHEFPPSPPLYKAVLTPCRYSMMNGSVYPSYLQDGRPPSGLVEHWKEVIPGFVDPVFVPEIPTEGKVYAYLPMENISNYVNDPHVHYHLCGKDALHLSKFSIATDEALQQSAGF